MLFFSFLKLNSFSATPLTQQRKYSAQHFINKNTSGCSLKLGSCLVFFSLMWASGACRKKPVPNSPCYECPDARLYSALTFLILSVCYFSGCCQNWASGSGRSGSGFQKALAGPIWRTGTVGCTPKLTTCGSLFPLHYYSSSFVNSLKGQSSLHDVITAYLQGCGLQRVPLA